jgi:hypothetical protein
MGGLHVTRCARPVASSAFRPGKAIENLVNLSKESNGCLSVSSVSLRRFASTTSHYLLAALRPSIGVIDQRRLRVPPVEPAGNVDGFVAHFRGFRVLIEIA